MQTILVVDDDSSMRAALSESLESCGYRVMAAENGSDALRRFEEEPIAAVITDMRMPRMSGMDVLRSVKKASPRTPVILITAYGTVSTAVEAMKEGASEFLLKPFSLDDLEFIVKNVLATKDGPDRGEGKNGGTAAPRSRDIVSQDAKVLSLLETLRHVARSKSSILIQGESGTGKELFARYVYLHSNRRSMPFVAVNCAAIPGNLLESEMFGYEKGAFTGAVQRKQGKFELADGGTLLLDEIGDMDLPLQAKLLRVLQESEIDRLGGRHPVSVDVRIIATTNADLKAAIEAKTFRADLYYRLNVIPVKIPPLRERRGDIALLAGHFIHKYCEVNERTPLTLSPEALGRLERHAWPGNVRELENMMERAVLMTEGGVIAPAHLHMDKDDGVVATICQKNDSPPRADGGSDASGDSFRIDHGHVTLRDMEKTLIFETLDRVNGNKTKASKILGISVRTMRNKLHEYGCVGEEDAAEG